MSEQLPDGGQPDTLHGRDFENGRRFLFKAMAPEDDDEGPTLQGIPEAHYLDKGPIAKSGVFHSRRSSSGIRSCAKNYVA